ncbi:3-hydroxybutyryl-CoA dehydrogenase [Streptomyces orinoci]|uniref:3-hydroxybutyryl-CoA dehydrogenase n=1 Tax=Streptomyces orinoci TaxID=67339 RepID=A0ABV3KA37_STRON|nr:3-hydroxybutyryl-CoA dehydrogenase [Streptomyces orinoci]
MSEPDIRRVGIVGCGLMGSGIAEVCAKAGLEVTVAVSRSASATAGLKRIRGSLDRAVHKGKLSETDRDAALGRISFTVDLIDLADRQLVVEAIKEDEPAKTELFSTLDKIVEDPDAILASNTSSIPIIRIARATNRPERVLGVHFFSPVPVLPLVELVGSLLTDQRVYDRTRTLVTETLGKQVIRSPDRAGFVVNSLLIPYLLSAIRMVDSGMAPAEVIDQGMTVGCAHPVGPLRLADMIGLDIVASVADALYEEYKEPLYAPPPLLVRLVEAGLLGRKTGRGFYTYR